MGKSDEGRKVDPANSQLEDDGGQPPGQSVDPSEKNRAARFREALKLPEKKGHRCLPLNPRIGLWDGVFWAPRRTTREQEGRMRKIEPAIDTQTEFRRAKRLQN